MPKIANPEIIIVLLSLGLLPLIYPHSVNAVSTWQKYSGNPVLDIGTPGSWDSVHIISQTVIRDQSEYKMWYAGYDGNRWRIGLATSVNGTTWTKHPGNPVFNRDLYNEDVHEPTIISHNGEYKMWHTNLNRSTNIISISYTTSSDGVHWSEPTSIFSFDQPWEGYTVSQASTLVVNGEFKMYYNGNSNQMWKIGLATSSNGLNWIKYLNNPVFVPDSTEIPTVGSPSVFHDGTKYIMFYHANHPPVNINYATSLNGINWTRNPNNPVLTISPTGFDSFEIVAPSVIAEDGTYKMWYSGSDRNHWRIGYATALITPIPPPTTKVVVVPGFGASWNADAILNCKADNYSGEWELIPVWGPAVYNPIMTALQNASMTPELFLYDWRQPVTSNAELIKPFIEQGLTTGERKYLVGHSMGGLVGRAYLEQVTTDHRLDKMMTVGTPHKGVPKAYPAWSAGEIWEDNLLKRIVLTAILKSCGLRNGQDDRETIQTIIPSVRDLLPTFDYLRDNATDLFKSVESMFAQNTWLSGSVFGAPFSGVTMGTLSGNTLETLSGMVVKNRNRHDERLGNWADGKPLAKEFSLNGDGTVLEMSGSLSGADNLTMALDHTNLIASSGGILQIFDFLGITPVGLTASSFVEPTSALVVIGYPANVWITDPTGKTIKDTQGLIAIANPKSGTYKLKLIPKTLGNIRIVVAQFLEDGRTLWKEYPYRSILPKLGTINFNRENPVEDILR